MYLYYENAWYKSYNICVNQFNVNTQNSHVASKNFHVRQFLEAMWLFLQYGYSHVFTIAIDIPIDKWL